MACLKLFKMCSLEVIIFIAWDLAPKLIFKKRNYLVPVLILSKGLDTSVNL